MYDRVWKEEEGHSGEKKVFINNNVSIFYAGVVIGVYL